MESKTKAAIYHVDNSLSDLKPDKKLRERQLHVKPLVEALNLPDECKKQSN